MSIDDDLRQVPEICEGDLTAALRMVLERQGEGFITYLFQIFLPLADNQGRPQDYELMRKVQGELTRKFGGLTAYSRAPAKGVWHGGGKAHKDDIVIVEVMSDKENSAWWTAYRKTLEKRFKQKEVLIRRQTIHVIPPK